MTDIVVQRCGSFPLESVFGDARDMRIFLRGEDEAGNISEKELFRGENFSEEKENSNANN
jgi:hypothetical protein